MCCNCFNEFNDDTRYIHTKLQHNCKHFNVLREFRHISTVTLLLFHRMLKEKKLLTKLMLIGKSVCAAKIQCIKTIAYSSMPRWWWWWWLLLWSQTQCASRENREKFIGFGKMCIVQTTDTQWCQSHFEDFSHISSVFILDCQPMSMLILVKVAASIHIHTYGWIALHELNIQKVTLIHFNCLFYVQ